MTTDAPTAGSAKTPTTAPSPASNADHTSAPTTEPTHADDLALAHTLIDQLATKRLEEFAHTLAAITPEQGPRLLLAALAAAAALQTIPITHDETDTPEQAAAAQCSSRMCVGGDVS